MLDNFEKVVARLIPICPIATEVGKKRKNINVAGLGGNSKHGYGPKIGVFLVLSIVSRDD